MEQLLAEKVARELKIDITQVVREYWELVFLKSLYESPYSRYLIFKGAQPSDLPTIPLGSLRTSISH